MINKEDIEQLAGSLLEGTDRFVMDIKVKPGNLIIVTIDGDSMVTIDDCINLSKSIENSLDRDAEDFELRVTSYGADSPLKILRQYHKHIGRELDITLQDDSKVKGRLTEVTENGIVIQLSAGKKKKVEIETLSPIVMDDIKEARIILSFK